jgi:hypothetical protein
MKKSMLLACLMLTIALGAIANAQVTPPIPDGTVLIEAEGFSNTGGWQIDQQFLDQMGSSMLIAHGMGRQVDNASTTVTLPGSGEYRVWVRTHDWASVFGVDDRPGRFLLVIDGRPLATEFGTEPDGWNWQDGGVLDFSSGTFNLALHDLTGFDGRCDAIVFTKATDWTPPNADPAMADFRRTMLHLPEDAPDLGPYDLVVVGGGMPGTCAAIGAARLGLKTALIQNRPVLGGNNSSEVRVHLNGKINLEPYPNLGNLVHEIGPRRQGNAQPADYYEDEKKLAAAMAEENLDLFLNTHVFEVETDGSKITAVIGRDITNGRELKFSGTLFADCTGDGCVGYLAGADFRMGREGIEETEESLAPEEPDAMTMGASVQWYTANRDEPVDFPDCPWALQFSDETVMPSTRGDWNWETGMNFHQVDDFERIRDHGLRAVYGNWSYIKNHAKPEIRERFANEELSWVAYVAGKRESRRLLGDVILQEQDIVGRREWPDACVTTTWTIDLHYPQPENTRHFPGEEFRSYAAHVRIDPYAIPYRCLYSRNIENLFMGGRNISVTHVALGTIRVMRTGGMMGEVIAMAASVCKENDTTPRGVYTLHLSELQALMEVGVAEPPPAPVPSIPPTWIDKAGDNLAPAATATASSDYNGSQYPVSNVNNGRFNVADNGGRYVSSADEMPDTIELKWDAPVTLDAVRILTGQSGRGGPSSSIIDFVLQTWNADAEVWIDIDETKTIANFRWDWNATFPETTTDRVRLLVTNAPGNLTRIWELELYDVSE